MKKTAGAAKISGPCGYWKHLRPFAKRVANKASRRFSKQEISHWEEAEELDKLRESEEEKERREAEELLAEQEASWDVEHQAELRYYQGQ